VKVYNVSYLYLRKGVASMPCEVMFKKADEISLSLRKGAILGSTEAAIKILKLISEASRECKHEFPSFLIKSIPQFISARPTSQVMLNLTRMFLERFLDRSREKGLDEALIETPAIVERLINEINEVREVVAEVGSRRIEDGDVILTHSFSSTILQMFKKALSRGTKFEVYVTESRPVGEGKVMASSVGKLGIKTTLVVDSSVRYVMKNIDKVFVGADAIAANGAVVNKVGTSAIALAAKEARTRVFVVAGLYKFGVETVFGELIESIVLNDPELILPKEAMPQLAGKVLIKAPLFDVTPPEYIDAIITEKGLIAPQAIMLLIKEIYGWPPKIKSIEALLNEVLRG